MIGIQAVASYIPPLRESNYDKKEQFEIDDEFIDNKIGVREKARRADHEETSDMCCRAFEALTSKVDILSDDIECLIVCSQNPDGSGLPHTSAIVHDKLGLQERIAAFDISLGCSGYVYSLSVMSSFMSANKMRKGFLFTADPYSKIVDPNDKTTSLLFGDAATATLLSDCPALIIEKAVFGTRGKEHEALQCLNGRLQMKGRAVFNFSLISVPPQIREVVQLAGCELDDIDLFVLHQGSKFLVDQLTRRLRLDPGKVPSNLAQVGNTVSSSIPLILEEYVAEPAVKNIVISGFGVGLSWASAVLTRPESI